MNVEKKLSGIVSSALGSVCSRKSRGASCSDLSDASSRSERDKKYGSQSPCLERATSKTKKASNESNDLLDKIRLKTALKVLRSNLSAGEKLSAIKRSHDELHQIKDDAQHEDWLQNLLDSNSSVNGKQLGNSSSCERMNVDCWEERNEIPRSVSDSLNKEANQIDNLQHKRTLDAKRDGHKNVKHSKASDRVDLQKRRVAEEVSNVGTADEMQTDGVCDTTSHERPASARRQGFKNWSLTSSSIKCSVDRTSSNGIATENEPTSTTNADTCERMSQKSSVHVQQWINSCHQDEQETSNNSSYFSQNVSVSVEKRISFVDEENNIQYDENQLLDPLVKSQEESDEKSEKVSGPRHRSLLEMKEKQDSFQSDVSNISNSSLSSIDTLLEARKGDPEEILLGLGFGGGDDVNSPLSRIPKRFLQPSQVKGNNVDEFVRQKEEMMEVLENKFIGSYRFPGWFENTSCFCSMEETSSRSSNSDLPVSATIELVSESNESADIIAAHFTEETFHSDRNISQTTCIVTIKVEDVG